MIGSVLFGKLLQPGQVSAVAGSCRQLFGNPNPALLQHNYPNQHPVAVALVWSVAIVVVCAPIASHLLRRRTTD